jgi:hypothetical protein
VGEVIERERERERVCERERECVRERGGGQSVDAVRGTWRTQRSQVQKEQQTNKHIFHVKI